MNRLFVLRIMWTVQCADSQKSGRCSQKPFCVSNSDCGAYTMEYGVLLCGHGTYMMTPSNGIIFHVAGPFMRGIHRLPVNSPHKGQWRGALMFSLICTWTNAYVNNRDACDKRHHCVHYDVTVMCVFITKDCVILWATCSFYDLHINHPTLDSRTTEHCKLIRWSLA